MCNLIRQTKSVCPVCLESLDASVIEKDDKVFLSKTCNKHGQFEILLSRKALYYKKLDEFYFTIMDEDKKLQEYEIWPTLKCNIDCNICCFGDLKKQMEELEPTCSEIENFIKKCKVSFYILSGGEPTCRKDLITIVKILKKYNKIVTINTNGLKLVDINYLAELKKSGLDRVNLQFDGFNRNAYMVLRGCDLLDIKLKVLENLGSLNMPTVLNATIAKNVNEDAIVELIEFAARNDFVNAINFFTICSLGGAKNWSIDNYIMPDEVVDILEENSNHKVTKKNVFLFQKLHLAVKSLLAQRYCFYNQIYLFIRKNDSYEPIDKFFNLAKTEFWLDKYKDLYKKSRFLSSLLLLLAFAFFLFRYISIKIIKELIVMSFSYFFKTPQYLQTKRFFYISFSTGCDPYKIDYSIVRNCQNEIIGMNSKSKKLEYLGRDGLYCIGLEKRLLGIKF